MFEFNPSFLSDPMPISPLNRPIRPGLHEDTERTFDGLHGVFNDSLPDGWGLLLMDRHFRQQGIDPSRITPLDRLAWMHTRGMGALTYHPAENAPDEQGGLLDLAELAREADSIHRGSSRDVLPQLRLAGSSPGGARPKIVVGFNAETGEMLSGTADLPAGFTHYLIKFGSQADDPEIGAIEFAYSLMARRAGITMAKSRLFHAAGGTRHFGTARFDRQGNNRLHVHTLGGRLHASHRIPSLGYDGYLKATRALTRDHRQLLEAYRRMVFNVLAHNRDDHVKNLAFLMSRSGKWSLAPAYDFVPSDGINGWHTMDVAGEANDPGRSDMLRAADAAGLSRQEAGQIIDEVAGAILLWPEFADRTELSAGPTQRIGRLLSKQADGTGNA